VDVIDGEVVLFARKAGFAHGEELLHSTGLLAGWAKLGSSEASPPLSS
jgi:hypothetical protein